MDYSKRLPLKNSLINLANKEIDNAIEMLGDCYPCTVLSVKTSSNSSNVVPIVTVKFEVPSINNLPQVTIPVAGSQYIRVPIKEGDQGLAVPATAVIGNITGLGSSFNRNAQPGNLEALVFLPIGNLNWIGVAADSVTIYADPALDAEITVSPTRITMNAKKGVIINAESTINASLNVTGNVTVGNGASGTFTSIDGLTVTVQDGIITNIH